MKRLLSALCLFVCMILPSAANPWLVVVGQPVAGGVAGPTYSAELTRGTANTNATTTAITTGAAVASGKYLIVCVGWGAGTLTQTLTSISDSGGNTYTISANNVSVGTEQRIAIASSPISTGLGGSDTITLSWGSSQQSYKVWGVFVVDNATAIDVYASNTGSSTSPSATASTIDTNTACVGFMSEGWTHAYSASNWTVIGSSQSWGDYFTAVFFYKNATSAGSQNPGGTLASSAAWGELWVALK